MAPGSSWVLLLSAFCQTPSNFVSVTQNQALHGGAGPKKTSGRGPQPTAKVLDGSFINSNPTGGVLGWGIFFSHGLKGSVDGPRHKCGLPTLSSQLQPLSNWDELGGTGWEAGWGTVLQRHLLRGGYAGWKVLFKAFYIFLEQREWQ